MSAILAPYLIAAFDPSAEEDVWRFGQSIQARATSIRISSSCPDANFGKL